MDACKDACLDTYTDACIDACMGACMHAWMHAASKQLCWLNLAWLSLSPWLHAWIRLDPTTPLWFAQSMLPKPQKCVNSWDRSRTSKTNYKSIQNHQIFKMILGETLDSKAASASRVLVDRSTKRWHDNKTTLFVFILFWLRYVRNNEWKKPWYNLAWYKATFSAKNWSTGTNFQRDTVSSTHLKKNTVHQLHYITQPASH